MKSAYYIIKGIVWALPLFWKGSVSIAKELVRRARAPEVK